MNRVHLHYNMNMADRKRYFEPISMTAALAALTAGVGTAGVGYGIGNIFGLFGGGKKSSSSQYDPLAGLRTQLQAIATRQQELASQVPGLVAKQKAGTAEQVARARTTGSKAIGERLHAEQNLGKTSIEGYQLGELEKSLFEKQSAADLAAEQWGLQAEGDIYGQSANTLSGISGMYPPEEGPSWQSQLLGAGAGMAAQNWMEENKWKNMANLFKGETVSPVTDWSSAFKEPDWKKYTTLTGAMN